MLQWYIQICYFRVTSRFVLCVSLSIIVKLWNSPQYCWYCHTFPHLCVPHLSDFLSFIFTQVENHWIINASAVLCLCSLLNQVCDDHWGYTKPLIMLHDNITINVSCANITRSSVLYWAPDQPSYHVEGSSYYFDPKFCGEKGFDPLCVELGNSCLDCRLLVHAKGRSEGTACILQ